MSHAYLQKEQILFHSQPLLCLNSGSASLKDLAFAVFEGESFGDTLLTVSTVIK